MWQLRPSADKLKKKKMELKRLAEGALMTCHSSITPNRKTSVTDKNQKRRTLCSQTETTTTLLKWEKRRLSSCPANGNTTQPIKSWPHLKPFIFLLCVTSLFHPFFYKSSILYNPKGNQPSIFIGRTDAEAESPIL